MLSNISLESANLLYSSAFHVVAKKYNVVLGVRSPNPLSFTLLKEGAPSKNFHMKAKSSPTGPTAGYITESPMYSKTPVSLWGQHTQYIDSAKRKGAQAVDLVLTWNRKNELINASELIPLGGDHYLAKYNNGEHVFFIDKSGNVFDDKKNTVKVMTNPPEIGSEDVNQSPITADYDLFAIIPRKNQSNNVRPLKIPPKLLNGKFNMDFLKPNSFNGQNEDVNRGNIHFFGQVIVNSLNLEIKKLGYLGGKLVWHNDETGNPFSPGFDEKDKPIFFTPTNEIYQARSKCELIEFYSLLRDNGYEPEYSPRFGF